MTRLESLATEAAHRITAGADPRAAIVAVFYRTFHRAPTTSTPRGQTAQRVLAALRDGLAADAGYVAAILGANHATVAACLLRLRRAGLVERVHRGMYRRAQEPTP